jgi:transketolase
MEVTSGSLGQCLSMASGVALARMDNNDSGRVWVFLSDGELQEGQTWEALEVIHHYNLNNLAIIVDCNQQQCDGTIDSVMTLGNIAEKLRAFGAYVVEINGHDIEAVQQAGGIYPTQGALVILARTNPCQGMDHLEKRRPRLHYVRFQSAKEAQELEMAIRQQLDATERSLNLSKPVA